MKKLLSKTRAAADRYGMLGQNEKIAVGVSGGKDSLMLLRLMAAMRELISVSSCDFKRIKKK